MNDLIHIFAESEMKSLSVFVPSLMMKGPLAVSELSDALKSVAEILYNLVLSIPDVLLSYAAQHMNTWFNEPSATSVPGSSVPVPAGSSSPVQSSVSEFVDLDLDNLAGGA